MPQICFWWFMISQCTLAPIWGSRMYSLGLIPCLQSYDTFQFLPLRSWYFWYFSSPTIKILTLLILFSSYHQDSGRAAPEGGEPGPLQPGLHHKAEVHGEEHHHCHLHQDHHDDHKYQVENIVGEQPEYIIWKKGNRMLNYDTERGGIRCPAPASNLSQHKLSFLGFVFVFISCSGVSSSLYLSYPWYLVPAYEQIF